MSFRFLLVPLFLAAGAAAAQSSAPAGSPPPAKQREPASAERLFADWDADKNGQLTLDEFRTGWETARATEILGRLEQQFRMADTNRSGFLEAGEYAALPVIKRAGGGAPPFPTFDGNRDQKIDFKEYLELAKAMAQRNASAK